MARLVFCVLAVFALLFCTQNVFAESRGSPDQPETMRILVFGDSLTDGYGLDYKEGFTVVLQQALRQQGYTVNVYNGSRSGATTQAGLQRVANVMQRYPDPHLVILALGANDFLKRIPLETTEQNLLAILAYFNAHNIPVFIMGIKAHMHPSPLYRWRFNRMFPRLAKKHAIGFMPDMLDGIVRNPTMNLPDGMHPNAYGISVMVDNLLPTLLPAMDKVIQDSAVPY